MKRWVFFIAGVLLPGLLAPWTASAETDLSAAATPVSAPAPSPQPQAEKAPDKDDGKLPAWVADLNPFAREPLGSTQYAIGVVEIGGLAGISPMGGDLGVGVHYVERGSLLAQMLFNAGSGAGAGARAVTTGKDQTYLVDASPRSNAGIAVDVLGGSNGGQFNFDLFYGIPFGSDRSPWVLDFGMTFGSFTGAKPAATKTAPYPEAPSRSYFGFVVGAVLPVTRWVQLEPGIRLDISAKEAADIAFAHLAAVGNIGNRLYIRLDGTYMQGLGMVFGAGVRL